jgi:hypothetical protein
MCGKAGVRPAIFAIRHLATGIVKQYRAATIENRKNRRPDPDLFYDWLWR